MITRQAYRFELDPTNAQLTDLARHAGAARYAFNWGLAERKRMLDAGEGSTNAIAQHKAMERVQARGRSLVDPGFQMRSPGGTS